MRAAGREGFVMPAVLTVVAVVTLVFLVTILALDSLTVEARQASDEIRFRQDALSAEADAAWLMATEPVSLRGIAIGQARTILDEFGGEPASGAQATAEVRLDGRLYAVPRQVGGQAATPLMVSMQDAAGQANVEIMDPVQKRRLFEMLGLGPDEAATFADRLIDYQDADDFRSPRGAEAEDYVRAGAGRPQNGGIARIDDLRGVLGFAEAVDARRWRAVRDALTADPTSGSVNINTLSPEAMAIVYGVAPDRAEAVIARRESLPFTEFGDFAAVSGALGTGSTDVPQIYPNGRVAFRALDRRLGIAYRSRLVSIPNSQERPIWVEDRGFTPLSAEDRRVDDRDAEPFPVPAP